ncbi:MAG: RNA methyltransferase [Clostridia bacterium]|nr:RNA methyltransferase [Clostridia bacterium]
MECLTAKQNEKIKSAVSVRDSAKTRRETGLFFLEGARLCADAAANGIAIYRAFCTSKSLEKYAEYSEKILAAAQECYEISEEIAQKLSDTQSPQGIFCLCRTNEKNALNAQIKPDGKYIFLENVQDPSNLGAVSRTAEALGVDGMFVCGGCDIYNPKALRASMGSALRLPIFTCENAAEVLTQLGENGMLTLASTPDSSALPITEVPMNDGVVCVVGNEGNGVTQETMSVCRHRVTIPMNGRAESLNASTAAAILIWEMVRK